MPNSAPARHAEMIKAGHMQTDSAYQVLLRAVQAHRAVKFELAHFYGIRLLK